MDDRTSPPLFFLLLVFSFSLLPLALCTSSDPLTNDQIIYVNANIGVDNETCGALDEPCKSLRYVVTGIYQSDNLTFVEIFLQTDILYEDFAIHAPLSLVTIHIEGNQSSIKGSALSIPKVEYAHTWLDSSTLTGHLVSFSECIVTQCLMYGIAESEEALQPALTLENCQFIDTNTSFHSLNITGTSFSNSPLAADGDCVLTHSNLTDCVGVTALSCGTCELSSCILSNNQGTLGGALSIFQFASIWDSVITNNSAVLGGGIYSQGIISLDNVEISKNVASQEGGGLYFYGPQVDLECVDTVLITGNTAEMGGAVAISSTQFSSNVEGSGQACQLLANQATLGGAIYINQSSASLVDFLLSQNIATEGAGIYTEASLVNLSSVTTTGNIGGGFHSESSIVVLLFSKFINNSEVSDKDGAKVVDMRLHNSSSQLTSWDRVVVSNKDAFFCDDCMGKLCSASSSCGDCRHSACMIMGTKPVCIEEDFGCVHGACEEMKDQTLDCDCDKDYTGDLCEDRTPIPFEWENTIFILAFGVGCLITILVVVGIIVRLHRHRAAYQPLLR